MIEWQTHQTQNGAKNNNILCANWKWSVHKQLQLKQICLMFVPSFLIDFVCGVQCRHGVLYATLPFQLNCCIFYCVSFFVCLVGDVANINGVAFLAFHMKYREGILTVYADFNPLRNYWRNTIRCDAQIRSHVQSGYSRYFQCVTIPLANCEINSVEK